MLVLLDHELKVLGTDAAHPYHHLGMCCAQFEQTSHIRMLLLTDAYALSGI